MRVLSDEELGLFAAEGYLAAGNIMPPYEVPLIRAELERLYRARGAGADAIDRPSALAPVLRQTETYQTCLRIARQVFGRPAWYSYDRALYKEPYVGVGSPWHQDQAFWGCAPMRTMHFWIPFQAATPQSGCLSYVPGSHRAGLLPHSSFGKSSYGGLICDEVDTTKAVVCPIPVGTVCMHTPTTIHSAHDNTSDSLSCAWTIHFSPYGRLLSWRPSHVAMRMRKFFGRPRVPAKAFARA